METSVNFRVRILFKSGNSQEVTCTKFEVTYRGAMVTKLLWELAGEQKILHIACEEIEAIFQLGAEL